MAVGFASTPYEICRCSALVYFFHGLHIVFCYRLQFVWGVCTHHVRDEFAHCLKFLHTVSPWGHSKRANVIARQPHLIVVCIQLLNGSTHLIVAHHLIVKWQYHLTVTLRHVIVKWGIHTACTLLVHIIYYQCNNICLLNGIFQLLFDCVCEQWNYYACNLYSLFSNPLKKGFNFCPFTLFRLF